MAITRQLLALSRRQVLQMHPLDLNQAINGLSNRLRDFIGEGIPQKPASIIHPHPSRELWHQSRLPEVYFWSVYRGNPIA